MTLKLRILIPFAVLLLVVMSAFGQDASQNRVSDLRDTHVIQMLHHDRSLPLTEMQPAPRIAGVMRVRPNRDLVVETNTDAPVTNGSIDSVMQMSIGTAATPAPSSSFKGVGNGFSGPQGSWTVNVAPPDTVGDVGPNYIVQAVNSGFAIFDKAGNVLYGPVNLQTLWSGFSGNCSKYNDGDPTVNYDQNADRWIIAQFAVSKKPYAECVAVSTGSDPRGSWYRYSYGFSDFPDYPKVAVWSNAYFFTYNMFTNFSGYGKVCAHDRAKMLAGQSNSMLCVNTATNQQGLLASELDGTMAPTNGPYMTRFTPQTNQNQLQTWKLNVNWAANTFTATALPSVTVASFTPACISATRGACIPQSGSTTKLESLGKEVMNRFAYRNFGDHESIVVAHSVGGDTAGQIRWYELRVSGGNPTLYQQGTYAPDTDYRWMPSIAMDKLGNIAVGYSRSGSIKPNIYYTSRSAADALGTMGSEATMLSGVTTGSQKGTYGSPAKELQRWGDYSAMVVDPADDCTFWFTTEYLPSDGIFNWSTRIGSFKMPGC